MKHFRRLTCFLLAIFMVLNFMPLPASSLDADETADPHPIISALNPGYTINNIQNTNEFIELYNPSGAPLPLTGYSLVYTNSSGNSSILYTFPDDSIFNGEYILLRLASSPEMSNPDVMVADASYSTTLAMEAGPLSLVYSPPGQDPVTVDSVCWKGTNCYKKFVAATPTSLRRCIVDGLSEACANGLDFEHDLIYSPHFDPESPGLYVPPVAAAELLMAQCSGLQFSEVFSYYSVDASEQFIELYNPTDDIIPLDGCSIFYKNKSYPLFGEISEYSYYAYQNPALTLTKNPTASNKIDLLDTTGEIIATVDYPHGQKTSTSYALIDGEWRQTYALTPNAENIYQEFRSCPEGKIINPATGNCINFVELAALPACPEGKYRNPETNRCKSVATATTSLTPCADGYERNPETNRCRKVTSNNGADYALAPLSFSDKSAFLAYGALAAVITTGLLYLVFQFRHELAKPFKKLASRRKIRV
jgi:hypothetical protein